MSKKEYVNRAFRLCDLFDDLNAIFVKYGQEQFGTCEFDFTIEGNLNVSFEYIDWKASKFGPGGKFDYYRYKSLVFCLKWNTQLKECMKLNNM